MGVKPVVTGPFIRLVSMYLSLGYDCVEISRIMQASRPSVYRALEHIKAIRNVCGDRLAFQKLFGIQRGRGQGFVMDLKADGKVLDDLVGDIALKDGVRTDEEE